METKTPLSGHQLEIDFSNTENQNFIHQNSTRPNDIYFLPKELENRVTFKPSDSFDTGNGKQINISEILVDNITVGTEHTIVSNSNPLAILKEPSIRFYLHIPETALDKDFSFQGKNAEDLDFGTPLLFNNLKDLTEFYLTNKKGIKNAWLEYKIIEERREMGTKFYNENRNQVLLFELPNGKYVIYPLHQTGRIKAEGIVEDDRGITYINHLTNEIKDKLNDTFGGYAIQKMNRDKEFVNKQASHRQTNHIQDYGEKIGGAKKDYYSAAFQNLQKYSNQELINSPLSQTLPFPNYNELAKDGIGSLQEIATLRFLRDRLNPKPSPLSYQYKINKWLSRVNLYKDYYKSLGMDDYFETNGHPYSDVVIQDLDTSEKNQLESFTKTILALGFPEKTVNLSGYEIRQFNDKGFAICLDNLIIKSDLSWNQAIETLNNIIEKKHKTFKIDFFQSPKDKTFCIGKRLPLQDIILASGFKTKREAVNYGKENLNQLKEKFNAMKLEPKERRESNEERIGKNYRDGKNIEPETFCQTFGFRGVEFGNWVQNKERQDALNNTYDSLMDLALITNIPVQAISLGGTLGMAFGSRGSGPYSAHYEPVKVVINLTKNHGAGSLAHEWWHALDNHFSKVKEHPLDFITENYNIQPKNEQNSIRNELISIFKNIVTSINDSDLRVRALNLDATRTKRYWSQTRELTARSFENWIVSKLEENHIKNDYLANFKTPEEWTTPQFTGRNYPYPTKEETEYINKHFQELFDTVQTKLDNSGHTILFRESESDANIRLKSVDESSKKELITEKESIINTAKENGVYLKTPNGESTNLSEEQWVQVRTKAFKEWFGDWENNPASASKVVDANGEPLVVYHGTDSEFFTFNHDRFAKNGFYFTQSVEAARTFKEGKYVAEVFLDIKNPIKRVYAPVISKKTIRSGYDGIISEMTTKDIDAPGYVVIHPNQIKSATDNIGTYRNNDNDIRFNIIGEIGAAQDISINDNLSIAKEMENSGRNPEEIFLATGWERTQDEGRWKHDLPTEDIRFTAFIKGNIHYGKEEFKDKLENVINYPALFKCYPTLGNIDIHFRSQKNENLKGSYHNNNIFINTYKRDALEILNIVVHEIQHSIQEIEGFAKGGTIEMFNGIKNTNDFINDSGNTPLKQYYNLAGEVEARNASSRLNMTPREKNMTPLSETEDVTEKNKKYQYGNREDISAEIDKFSHILNTPVDKVNTRQELPEYIQKVMNPNTSYSGLYDITNNKVYTILDEIKDIREAQSTILHEVLGHKGIIALFKNTREENEFFQKVWDIIPPKERSELFVKYKSEKIGAEEYLAKYAESYKEPKVWEKIKAAIKTFFRKLGVNLQLTDTDLKNILCKAKRNLQQIQTVSTNSAKPVYTMNM